MDDTRGDQKTGRSKPNLMTVRGILFAGFFPREYIESAVDYDHQEGDLFIVTYVKCGTTWMQHIVYLIQNNGVPPANAAEFYEASPHIDIFGSDCVKWMRRPGAIKTHIPLHLMRYSPNARYIVVIRNPLDALVSIHNFWLMISAYNYDGDFNESFRNFMEGYVDSGNYFTFYKDWYERSRDDNVLFMVYEDMKKDPEEAILKVARFLGPEYEERLLADGGKVLKDVLKYSSFEEMKKYTNEMIHNFFVGEFPFQGVEYAGLRKFHEIVHRGRSCGSCAEASADKIYFVRKGIVGDWKNYFSAKQFKMFKEWFRLQTEGSGIAKLWPDLCLHE